MIMDFEQINECVDFAADVFVIIGGLIAIIQICQSRYDAKEEIKRHKKETTILYMESVLTKLSKLDEEILKVCNEDVISPDSLKLNKETKNQIKDFLKSMERLSVGLNSDVYDIEIVSRIIGTGIVKTWRRLELIIKRKRMEQDNENLYIEFEHVVEKIRNAQENVEGKGNDN